MEYIYDSIYPLVSITSEELGIEELFGLSEKVTKEIYKDNFPMVEIETNKG